MRLVAVLVLLSIAAGVPVRAETLHRALSSYFLFAQRKAALKNLSLDASCSIGVDCASPNPNSSCGALALGSVTFVDGSQAAADKTFFRKPGAVVSQVCRNNESPLANVTMGTSPEKFTTPIIAGGCDSDCRPNPAPLETLCGFPVPFPTCDPTRNVLVRPGADCTADGATGNSACDLSPGRYGYLLVQNGARLNLGPGDYVACGVQIGRNVTLRARETRILVPDGGFFKGSNGSTIAEGCGDLSVLVQGRGSVSFGRHTSVAAQVCAPASRMKLGHDNQLLGRFVGDTITADSNNHARCCAVTGDCACYSDVSPRRARVGDAVTLATDCDLGSVSAVRVCGLPAAVVAQTKSELMFTVPAGAAGNCVIEVDSPAGTFEGTTRLSVG
jgi:hypothetical protein